jgi:hypothetical protein
MAMTITVQLKDLDEKCMRYLAASPQEWVENFVASRIFAAKQEIYQAEVRRMTEDPSVDTIPASVDAVVAQAQIRYADEQPTIPSMAPPQG